MTRRGRLSINGALTAGVDIVIGVTPLVDIRSGLAGVAGVAAAHHPGEEAAAIAPAPRVARAVARAEGVAATPESRAVALVEAERVGIAEIEAVTCACSVSAGHPGGSLGSLHWPYAPDAAGRAVEQGRLEPFPAEAAL